MKKILTFIIVITSIFIIMSYVSESIMQKSFFEGFTKRAIANQLTNSIFYIYDDIDKDMVYDNIIKSKELENINDKIINTIMDDLLHDKITKISFNTEINSICLKYRKELCDYIDINSTYKLLIEYIKTKINVNNIYIKIYNFFIMPLVRVLCIISLILSVLLISFINKSFKESLFNYGIALLIISSILIVMIFIVRKYGNYLSLYLFGNNSIIDLSIITVLAIISLIGSLVLLDIYEKE